MVIRLLGKKAVCCRINNLVFVKTDLQTLQQLTYTKTYYSYVIVGIKLQARF